MLRTVPLLLLSSTIALTSLAMSSQPQSQFLRYLVRLRSPHRPSPRPVEYIVVFKKTATKEDIDSYAKGVSDNGTRILDSLRET
jgi:hypothetical protein